MTEVNFGADLEAAEKEFNIGKGDDKYKFQEGDNRFRILTKFAPLQNTYKGNTSVKFLCFVNPFGTNDVKLAFFPYTIAKHVAALQSDPDWSFTEVPMPYDLNVKAKNAGTKDVEYNIVPSPNKVPVAQEILDALAQEKPIEEVRDLIHEKSSQEPAATDLPV